MKVVIFDGVCNLCEFWVNFIIENDKQNIFLFLPLQSAKVNDFIEVDKIENLQNSVILYDDGVTHFKSDAALLIMYNLNTYWRFLYYFKFIPKLIRDKIYDLIAGNRYRWFGKKEKCLIPSEEIKHKFIV